MSGSTDAATPTAFADGRSRVWPGSCPSATRSTPWSTTVHTGHACRSRKPWPCSTTEPEGNGIPRSSSCSWARCPQSTGSAPPERAVSQVLGVLQNVTTLAFVLLGVATGMSWARHRDRSQGFLALAIILLSLVSLLSRIPSHLAPKLLSTIDLILFVGSAYALLRFRGSLIPVRRAWHVAAVAAMVTGLALFIGASLFEAPTQVMTVAAFVIIMVWGAIVVEPIIRFWLVARGLPVVQAWRLRSLSLGFAGIVGILVFAIGVSLV